MPRKPDTPTQQGRSVSRQAMWDVLVCRGCCCGTSRKHRSTDHAAQLEAVRAAAVAGGGARVQVTTCLDQCSSSNVVVLRPPSARRRDGARAIWLGRVLTPQRCQELCDWLARGGPEVEELPLELLDLAFHPSRR